MVMFDKHKGSKQAASESPETRTAPAPQPAPAAASGPADKVAMIGRGISIEGDVKAASNLRIEGEIEGRGIQSSHDIEISESGRVVAGITAKNVRISGEVTGDIAASEKVLIARSGRVQGNVVAPRVQLEDGALFRGSIDMTPEAETKPAAGPAREAASAKPAVSAVKDPETAAAGARKEPGLTLKSG